MAKENPLRIELKDGFTANDIKKAITPSFVKALKQAHEATTGDVPLPTTKVLQPHPAKNAAAKITPKKTKP
jgi:hypothetical protein